MNRGSIRTLIFFLFPILLLVGVIALFLYTSGAGLNVKPVAPIESVVFERTILRPGEIEFQLRNTSPQEIALSTLIINDAVWQFAMSPDGAIPRLGSATVTTRYPWVEAETYAVKFFTSSAIAFETIIDAATETKTADRATLLSFTLIGVYVGVVPVLLGMMWLPVLRRLSAQWYIFLMALTVGLLIYLGIDAINEALEVARELGGAFQGVGLIGIGVVTTFVLLDAIARRQQQIGRSEAEQRFGVALMIAVGIGLHNLGEGLAIGASFSIGAAALGTFLVIGFILQNITEGLAIVAPVAKDHPGWRSLLWLGLIGGAPAIAGAWIGGLTYSQPLATLFLAIGAGAVFEVVYEIAKLIQRDVAKRPMFITVFAGVTTGMLLLYITGLLIK
jgi:zinc transporter ZupT